MQQILLGKGVTVLVLTHESKLSHLHYMGSV